MLTAIKENSVVLLKDGRDGTILFVYNDDAYLIEIEDGSHDRFVVTLNQVAEVIWEP
jgi:hypothetical protein